MGTYFLYLLHIEIFGYHMGIKYINAYVASNIEFEELKQVRMNRRRMKITNLTRQLLYASTLIRPHFIAKMTQYGVK